MKGSGIAAHEILLTAVWVAQRPFVRNTLPPKGNHKRASSGTGTLVLGHCHASSQSSQATSMAAQPGLEML